MSTINVEGLTIAKVHQAYTTGLFTARDLVAAYLERIQKLDKDPAGPRINATLAINQNALAEASKLDESLKREGRLSGSLHGVPLIIKDTIQTAGLATTFGSVIGKDHVPTEDAFLVTRLKEAGAIIIAKGAMPDWGCDYFSDSSLSGPTLNPHDVSRDAGGSSSGCAAALAANLALAAVGSDSAGSARIPSSFCGVVGYRPTVGLISGRGCMNGILRQGTQAPIAGCVEDAARLLDVLAVFDGGNHLSAVHALRASPGGGGGRQGKSYTEQLRKCDLASTRIGVIPALFGDDSTPAQAGVNKTVRALLAKLASSAGATLVDIEIPDLATHLRETDMFLTRFRADVEPFIREKFHTSLTEIIAAGRYPAAVNAGLPWIAAHGLESPYDHPDRSASGPDLGGGVAAAPRVPDYGRQLDATALFSDAVLARMLENDVSALVFPTAREVAPRREGLDVPTKLRFPLNTSLASQLRWPALSLPAGFEEESGMPVGLEIVVPPLRDGELLGLGAAVEGVVGGRRAPRL